MLRKAEFLYNNLVYITTSVSLFFIFYSYYLNIRLFIKREVLKNNVLIARERGEEIVIICKTLSK
jgi:hypothetical protein